MENIENIENQANGGVETGKTFTQDEVNHIITKRLNEERGKFQKEQDAAFADREKELKSREMRLFAREQLREKGLPDNFVDAINCSDEEAIKKSIEILEKSYTGNNGGETPKLHGMTPASSTRKPVGAERTIRDAMGL